MYCYSNFNLSKKNLDIFWFSWTNLNSVTPASGVLVLPP